MTAKFQMSSDVTYTSSSFHGVQKSNLTGGNRADILFVQLLLKHIKNEETKKPVFEGNIDGDRNNDRLIEGLDQIYDGRLGLSNVSRASRGFKFRKSRVNELVQNLPSAFDNTVLVPSFTQQYLLVMGAGEKPVGVPAQVRALLSELREVFGPKKAMDNLFSRIDFFIQWARVGLRVKSIHTADGRMVVRVKAKGYYAIDKKTALPAFDRSIEFKGFSRVFLANSVMESSSLQKGILKGEGNWTWTLEGDEFVFVSQTYKSLDLKLLDTDYFIALDQTQFRLKYENRVSSDKIVSKAVFLRTCETAFDALRFKGNVSEKDLVELRQCYGDGFDVIEARAVAQQLYVKSEIEELKKLLSRREELFKEHTRLSDALGSIEVEDLDEEIATILIEAFSELANLKFIPGLEKLLIKLGSGPINFGSGHAG